MASKKAALFGLVAGVLAGTVVGIYGFAAEGGPRVAQRADLEGHRFELISATGRRFTIENRPTLTFAGGKLDVATGCNSFYGDYELGAGRLAQHGPSTTQMGCGRVLTAQQEWLGDLLEAGVVATVADDSERLTLRTARQTLRLVQRTS